MKALWHISIFLAALPASAQSFESWSVKAQKAQSGDPAIAVEYWTNALRLWDPAVGRLPRSKALVARAELLHKLGRLDEALSDVSVALTIDTKNPALFDLRGQIYLQQDRVAEATADFYSATKLNLNYGPAYFHRGQAYARNGDQVFAREDYRTACKLGHQPGCAAAQGDKPDPEPSKIGKTLRGKKPAAAPAAAPVPAKPGAAPTFQACLSYLDNCSEEGNSIGVCVKKAKICEEQPQRGCCPQECVKRFMQAPLDKSDAELFRSIFSVKGSCSKRKTSS